MCGAAHSDRRSRPILPPFTKRLGECAMTTAEQLPTQPAAPSFRRAALGFLGSTACLCLVMVALSSF